MPSAGRFFPKARATAVAGFIAAATLIAPLGAMPGQAARSHAPVTITMWAWSSWTAPATKVFEQTHPDIKVNLVNLGGGPAQYSKLHVALKAGSGLPDAAMIEDYILPEFELTGALADLTPYGAKALAKDYLPADWSQMLQGSKIYGIPLDFAPMALAYRTDIFAKYHLKVPTTWAQYEQEAIALHKADPGFYMGNSPLDEGNFLGMLWQAKDHPFGVQGTTVSFNLTDPIAQKVLTFWTKLAQEHAVSTVPGFTSAWNTQFNHVATWIAPSWADAFLPPAAPTTKGKWRVALLPSWNGAPSSALWGGSAYAVLAKSPHPAQAAEYVMWINHAMSAVNAAEATSYGYDALSSFSTPANLNKPDDFYGGQATNEVYFKAGSGIDLHWQWDPFMTYTNQQVSTYVLAAERGKTSASQALSQLQTSLVSYAKNQGFTVK